ncbi:ABC transporter permease [Galbibacter pacificus]|uniref:ABC transporter permease n=1 Tax=Galbibacter pacificus TaxID=2996052 RepID=A0ABT6FSU2_9FLAO|nr:ABC transporter permease [Galbibacter pacificus]MDG3582566.1 ABC transporter permease [Galbibacter pacificus]MDG3586315.1 ABC transporter permease [Galbibacter pacificus]
MGILDRDLWSEVFSTLSKNMLRTFLTTLGVIFAILILILLLGATTGMSNGFNKIFAGTATNSMFMWTQTTSIPYKGFERGRRIDFTLEDVALIKRQVSEVDIIAPRIQLGDFGGTSTVIREGRSSGSGVYGDYPSIDLVSKKRIVEGRFINQNDIEESKKVCVIGLDAYKLLFDKGEKAIGKSIQINGIYFSVVGIFKKNDNINFEGENAIFVPFTTFQKAFNSGNKIGWMAILVDPDKQVSVAEGKIKKLLKQKYNIHPDDVRAIGSFDFSEIFKGISAFTFVLQGFSFFVGIFTLLAGVIAVSNILLITVKERTNEIGVRRALGATPKIIKRQIILESIVLTTFAGLVGFVISVAALHFLDYKFGGSDEFPFVNPTVSIPQIVFSFILMVGLSMLIGLIPANRAVKIKPIEALREE